MNKYVIRLIGTEEFLSKGSRLSFSHNVDNARLFNSEEQATRKAKEWGLSYIVKYEVIPYKEVISDD
jgi:hypothetical protein